MHANYKQSHILSPLELIFERVTLDNCSDTVMLTLLSSTTDSVSLLFNWDSARDGSQGYKLLVFLDFSTAFNR